MSVDKVASLVSVPRYVFQSRLGLVINSNVRDSLWSGYLVFGRMNLVTILTPSLGDFPCAHAGFLDADPHVFFARLCEEVVSKNATDADAYRAAAAQVADLHLLWGCQSARAARLASARTESGRATTHHPGRSLATFRAKPSRA